MNSTAGTTYISVYIWFLFLFYAVPSTLPGYRCTINMRRALETIVMRYGSESFKRKPFDKRVEHAAESVLVVNPFEISCVTSAMCVFRFRFIFILVTCWANINSVSMPIVVIVIYLVIAELAEACALLYFIWIGSVWLFLSLFPSLPFDFLRQIKSPQKEIRKKKNRRVDFIKWTSGRGGVTTSPLTNAIYLFSPSATPSVRPSNNGSRVYFSALALANVSQFTFGESNRGATNPRIAQLVVSQPLVYLCGILGLRGMK